MIFEGTRLDPPRRFSKMLHSWCSLSRFWRREVAAATDRPSDGPRRPRWRQVVAELKPEEREHVTEAVDFQMIWVILSVKLSGWLEANHLDQFLLWKYIVFLKSFNLLYP